MRASTATRIDQIKSRYKQKVRSTAVSEKDCGTLQISAYRIVAVRSAHADGHADGGTPQSGASLRTLVLPDAETI